MEVTMENQRDLLSRVSEEWGKSRITALFCPIMFFRLRNTGKRSSHVPVSGRSVRSPGAHGCGILFLKTFVRDVLKIKSMVTCSYAYSCQAKNMSLITTPDRYCNTQCRLFYSVEVKIYAGEQQGQCFDLF